MTAPMTGTASPFQEKGNPGQTDKDVFTPGETLDSVIRQVLARGGRQAQAVPSPPQFPISQDHR